MRRFLVVPLAIVALHVACRSDRASTNQSRADELFTARSLGLGYLQKDQLPEAEEQFEKLTRLAPDDPMGYANLGLTFLRAGRLDEAERQLKRARELDPGDIETGLMLAKLYQVSGRGVEARRTLEGLRRGGRSDARVFYALAELESADRDPSAAARYAQRLREALALAPSNLAVRLKLVDAFARLDQPDSAVRQLEDIRRIPPEPPRDARVELESAVRLLRTGRTAEARGPLGRLFSAMELTKPYQAALEEVRWLEGGGGGPIAGRPVLTFAPKTLITLRGARAGGLSAADVRFVDATTDAGLPEIRQGTGGGRAPASRVTSQPAESARGAVAVGDYDGDGSDDLFLSLPGAPARLYHGRAGQFQDATTRAGATPPEAVFATFADVDNDGWLDLFLIGADGRAHLLRNTGGKFEDASERARITTLDGATSALFVDLDHDGDLDLLLIGGHRQLVYRNNLDGTFTEASAAMGLAGEGARAAAFGDLDGDGRIDVVAARSDATALYLNGGALRFADSASAKGLRGAVLPAGATARARASTPDAGVAVGDFDNDGALDLFIARPGDVSLWRNTGSGTFTRWRGFSGSSLLSISPLAATFFDFDNDGWLDLLIVGLPRSGSTSSGRGVTLWHNDGTGHFVDRSAILPPSLKTAASIDAVDVDADGDLDLVIGTPEGGVHLLRNEGGNARMAANIELHALRTGSGKNNTFGIGSRVDLRAGDLLETRVVTDRVTHFGLGPHLKADVVRVEWTNGVPQTIYLPGSDQDVLEGELLKGSCAFLYTWDGTRFRFVTDVMWRSALGMPLGIMGRQDTFAPAGASQEYLRIPGNALRPRDGRYVLQFTEELWETSYTDEIRLLAVDHPDSVGVFVDERFVPPAPVSLRLYKATRPHPPLSAVDDRGNDLLPALRSMDGVYASDLTPSAYQGLVEPHDLVMDLGPEAGQPGAHLFLRGWIYPTDASINVALGQQAKLRAVAPSLEVRDVQGRWVTAAANIGFPSGKDKTVVVDLAGLFRTADHHVRIRTNMQIYWDQAFVSVDAPGAPVRVTTLAPLSANLHYRGFSRTYRKGGRYGPHWFDYGTVSRADPWRPIEGAFTRFGDVLPLLRAPDDMYVIMGPGDETTVEYDAASAGELPPGWTRDFLLYTDGWIKDSDLNTAYGTTVEPLPFHAIRSYPYAEGEAYPADSAHTRYLREYNTRVVRRSGASAQSLLRH